jgi:hypothetical protein
MTLEYTRRFVLIRLSGAACERDALTKRVIVGALVIFFMAACLSCRKERTYTAEVKDAVRYVHNLKPASEKPVADLSFVRKIGELDSKDPDFQFVRPMGVAEDGQGNLFILDDKDGCVKKFAADRKFLLKFGRPGQGPGEFEYPMTVEVGVTGRVVVSTMSSDFHVFDNDGMYIDRFRLPPYRGISPALLSSDRVVAYAFELSGENSRDNHILAIFDPKGGIQHEFGEAHLLGTARNTWQANFPQIAVDGADDIYVAFSNQNRIEKYSGTGQLLLSIDRVLPYEIEYRYTKSSMEIRGKAVPVDEPDFTPVSRGIGVDGRGRIWVLTFRKALNRSQMPKDFVAQDYLAFEVYDKDGVLLSRLPFPREVVKFDNMTMHGDHVFFADPFDQACVYEYAVENGRN